MVIVIIYLSLFSQFDIDGYATTHTHKHALSKVLLVIASDTTTSKRINIEHLEEQSDIIIYIVGLIVFIIWKITVIW